MGRVLRIGAMVMGVLLVVMTAGVWVLRETQTPEKLMVLKITRVELAPSESLIDSQLVLKAAGKNQVVPLVPAIYGSYSEPVWTPDGAWGYFIGEDWRTFNSTIYRIKGNGCCVEPLFDSSLGYHYWDVRVSPDGGWLSSRVSYFDAQNQNTGRDTLLLIYLPSRQIRDLGTEIPYHMIMDYPNIGEFSTDGRYLEFTIYNPNVSGSVLSYRDKYFIYHVNLATGRLEDAEKTYGGWLYRNMFFDEELVLVKGLHRHFHVRRDGTDADFYVQLAPREMLPAAYDEQVEAWIPERNLLILNVFSAHEQRIMGFPLEGGTPYWSLDGMKFSGASVDLESLFLTGADNNLYQMDLATQALENLGGARFSYSPNEWNYLGLWGSNWAYPQGTQFYGDMPLIYRLNPLPNSNRVWSDAEKRYILRWITLPTKNWQPILLFAAGGVLMISATRPFRRFKKWRQTVSA